MEEQLPVAPIDNNSVIVPPPPVSNHPPVHHAKIGTLNLLILVIILAIIPVTVIVMAQQTRRDVKAAVDCKQPVIPDPADCIGGKWKLANSSEGCVRFQCEVQ